LLLNPLQCPVLLQILYLIFQFGRFQLFFLNQFPQIIRIQPEKFASFLHLIPNTHTDFHHPHPRQRMNRHIAPLFHNPFRFNQVLYPPFLRIHRIHTGQLGSIYTLGNQCTNPHQNKENRQPRRNLFLPFHLNPHFCAAFCA
jgi:hypothetical protein